MIVIVCLNVFHTHTSIYEVIYSSIDIAFRTTHKSIKYILESE